MKTDIVSKYNPTNPEIPKLEEFQSLVATKDNIKEGDLFLDSSRERLLIISEIKDDERVEKLIVLYTVDSETFQKEHHWTTLSLENFLKEYSSRFIPDWNEYSKQAEDYLFNGKPFLVESLSTGSSTALIHKTNKQLLVSLYGEIELKTKKLSILQGIVSLKMYEQQQKLRKIRSKMEEQINLFQKEMNKIMKVIGMIELYLGIEEELYQLQEGQSPSVSTPITLRQLVLYADEELGNCDDGGIDFRQLSLFDNWLVKDKNYLKLLPEERGIVALKPRRFDKDYHDDYENKEMNRWNKETYFLIRNGENLFRICSPHIGVSETMFPRKDEFQEILLNIDKMQSEHQKEQFENMYMKMTLFFQGLIDRTDVFNPLTPGIKVTDLESSGGINLIYDAEPSLTDGRLSFKDWQKQINSNVGRGSRIILSPSNVGWCLRDGLYHHEGFFKYYSNEYSMPDTPSSGLYTIEEEIELKYFDKSLKAPVIRYMPSSETYSWTEGATKRKNRVTWVIDYKHSWYLNYDRISLDDVDYYLNSRLERKNYLSILPLLKELKKHLIQEMVKESDFKKMLQGLLLFKFGYIEEELLEEKISEAIYWWKYKNIWKRPITQDDTKACKMIQSKLFLDFSK